MIGRSGFGQAERVFVTAQLALWDAYKIRKRGIIFTPGIERVWK